MISINDCISFCYNESEILSADSKIQNIMQESSKARLDKNLHTEPKRKNTHIDAIRRGQKIVGMFVAAKGKLPKEFVDNPAVKLVERLSTMDPEQCTEKIMRLLETFTSKIDIGGSVEDSVQSFIDSDIISGNNIENYTQEIMKYIDPGISEKNIACCPDEQE